MKAAACNLPQREPPFPVPYDKLEMFSVENPVLPHGRAASAKSDEDDDRYKEEHHYLKDLSTMHVDSRYWSYDALQPVNDMKRFLTKDFDVSRLDKIYDLLWWAGRQVPPRPLHRTRMMGRKIAITEQADLHLVWSAESMFLKPLPNYLLTYSFWTCFVCEHEELDDSLRGFLLSYMWLIRHKSDFKIAKDEGLIPSDLKWEDWKVIADAVCQKIDVNNPTHISNRYRYGELRISRLDQIYRFSPRFMFAHLVRGYFYSYSSYGGFFKREFAWLVVSFAYVSIILSAMQVGLTTDQLKDNNMFNSTSYGFSILAIVFTLSISGTALLAYLGLWMYHLGTTLLAVGRGRRRERR